MTSYGDRLIPITTTLPGEQELIAELLRCCVPHEDINALLRFRPDPVRDPEQWNVLEEGVDGLREALGRLDSPAPPLTVVENPYLLVYTFIAALDDVREYHRARGIPGDVSWLTLTDLGRHMAAHRRLTGSGGLDDHDWLSKHFTGRVYTLGRLQFERIRLDEQTARAIAATGGPAEPGDTALSVHIPDNSGPLSPEACDYSFARAGRFFAHHFPEEEHRVAICSSWLLDTQLLDHLPADSNVLAFQRRFQNISHGRPNDNVLRFVFGVREGVDLSTLPRRTRVEKAMLEHLEAGGHWRDGVGWIRL